MDKLDQVFPLVTYTPIQVKDRQNRRVKNLVCQELPLEIRINDTPYATLMRTPTLEKELAIGFCFTDKVLTSIDDISNILCTSTQGFSYITTVALVIPRLIGQDLTRQSLLKSSSASVNNPQILEDLLHNEPPPESETPERLFDLSVLNELPDKLNACQVLRAKCGATHGAALFSHTGKLVCCTEDVGRHNALDKLIGFVLLNRIDTRDKMLMLSSRASFEMIQKAGSVSIPVVATISAPTDLALRVAERLRCTYISFLKKGGYNIYTHPWRFGVKAR
jgi:FdhD protein